jgi:ElaB/YqjD/DUF883 family membrane-anchored ribosome-binding protein
MGEDQGAVSAQVTDQHTAPAQQTPDDPAELREDIERTRQELGDTVAALAEKTDVKTRAKDKVAGVKQTVNERRTELVSRARENSPDGANSAAAQVRAKAEEKPIHTAAIAAFVGGFLLGRITGR